MSDNRARMLSEADWQVVRDLRLEALRDSPESFVASYDEESQQGEQFWREPMRRARWFVAERDADAVGVLGVGLHCQDAEQAFAEGRRRLFFWVASDSGPAVASPACLVSGRPPSVG